MEYKMKRTLLLCTTALSIVWGAETQEEPKAGSENDSPKMIPADTLFPESGDSLISSQTAEEISIYRQEVQEQLTALAEMQRKASEATEKAEYASAVRLYRRLSAALKTLCETHPDLQSERGIIDLRTHALYGLVNSLWKLTETSELIPLLDEVAALNPSEKDTESFKRMSLNAHISCVNAAMETKDQVGYENAAALQDNFLTSLDAVLAIEGEPKDATKDACKGTLHLLCVANYALGKHAVASVLFDKIKSISDDGDKESLVALAQHFNNEDKWIQVRKAGEELEKRNLMANVPEDVMQILNSAKEKVAFLESAQQSLTTYMAEANKALSPNYPAAAEALEGWLSTVDELAKRKMLLWGALNNIRMYTDQAMTLLKVKVKMGNNEDAVKLVNQVQLRWDLWWEGLEEKGPESVEIYTKSLMHQSSLYLQFSAFDEMEKVLNKAVDVSPSIKDKLDYLTLYLDMQILRMNKLVQDEKYEDISTLVEAMIESINSLFEKLPEQKEKLLPILSVTLEKAKTSCKNGNKEETIEKIDAKLLEWNAPKEEEVKTPTLVAAEPTKVMQEEIGSAE